MRGGAVLAKAELGYSPQYARLTGVSRTMKTRSTGDHDTMEKQNAVTEMELLCRGVAVEFLQQDLRSLLLIAGQMLVLVLLGLIVSLLEG
jgi:hypothetical protein